MIIADPIIKKIPDNIDELKLFEQNIKDSKDKKMKDIIMNYPVVYIHTWKSGKYYEVYVGQSNNIFQRTRQHYDKMSDKNAWQHKLSKSDANLYIIGHEHFNKSMTLDIESKLIQYLMSVENIKKVNNLKRETQNRYYLVEEFDKIFPKIWDKLSKDNRELFPFQSSIKDSAIYKASPLHKLTEEQQEAKGKIIEKVIHVLKNNKKGQLIFVEGQAGTGKTVLNSSTFYELICRYEETIDNNESVKYETSNCCLVVNHNEQVTVYKQIANKLGLTDKYGEIVYKPTRFINRHSCDNRVDVAFVDEAHLLLTQGKQSYCGNNQLEDILDRAHVVVVMFDKRQVLTAEQYWESEKIEKYKNQAIKNGNYIKLKNQLRIKASKEVINWINSFTEEGIINKMPVDRGNYDIQIFDTPEQLEKKIKSKASKDKSKLSRLIASYDWNYSEKNKPDSGQYWEVKIGEWHKPWNRELQQDLDKEQKGKSKALSWAEQPQTINEVGSTFTIHGFDLSYAGVIIGPSVKYRDGHIVFDSNESCNKKATRNRTLSDGTSKNFAEEFLRNELGILMTRGVNGLYIYACDDKLREKLKECCKKS